MGNRLNSFLSCEAIASVSVRYKIFEFFRYFFVSLVALVVDFSLYTFFIRVAGVSWFWSASIGFLVGVVVAYFLSIRFVFYERKLRGMPRVETAYFVFVGIFGLGVTQLVLWCGVDLLSQNAELSKLVAAGLTFCFNYLIRKNILFKC